MNRLIQMILRAAMAALMTVGVPRLIDWWARRGHPDKDPNRPLTPDERRNAQRMRSMTNRARDLYRITRRFGR